MPPAGTIESDKTRTTASFDRRRSETILPSAFPRRKRHETSPPTISASGRRRCRAAGRVVLRLGASLSDANGAHRRHFSRRRLERHRRTTDRSMAVGTPCQPFVIANRGGGGG